MNPPLQGVSSDYVFSPSAQSRSHSWVSDPSGDDLGWDEVLVNDDLSDGFSLEDTFPEQTVSHPGQGPGLPTDPLAEDRVAPNFQRTSLPSRRRPPADRDRRAQAVNAPLPPPASL